MNIKFTGQKFIRLTNRFCAILNSKNSNDIDVHTTSTERIQFNVVGLNDRNHRWHQTQHLNVKLNEDLEKLLGTFEWRLSTGKGNPLVVYFDDMESLEAFNDTLVENGWSIEKVLQGGYVDDIKKAPITQPVYITKNVLEKSKIHLIVEDSGISFELLERMFGNSYAKLTTHRVDKISTVDVCDIDEKFKENIKTLRNITKVKFAYNMGHDWEEVEDILHQTFK